MTRVLAWDIGGANVKAALADAESARAVTRPFALWRDREALPAVLREMADALGDADEMALTMTAELADCFASKAEGIAFVLAAVRTSFPRARLHILDTSGRFRRPADALEDPAAVASANWAATAHWLAREEKDALLIDVGTTTTDVIPIVGGAVVAEGRTDPDRLASGELVYTGAVRTPCAALARTVRVGATRYRVVAERFAQSGDAHLWLGGLGEHDYLGDTPDGRGVTRADAGARLARMIAADASALGDAAITEIARAFAERQVRLVT
ncbi:MAG: hydantoinase/oxoprolinase family protein, partial [Gemmatimonadota bacterium]